MNKQVMLIALIIAFGVSAKAEPTNVQKTESQQPSANMPQKVSHSKVKPAAVRKQTVTKPATPTEKSMEVKVDTAAPPIEKKN